MVKKDMTIKARIEALRRKMNKGGSPDLPHLLPPKRWPPTLEERVSELEKYWSSSEASEQNWVDEIMDNIRIVFQNTAHLKQMLDEQAKDISDLLARWPGLRKRRAKKK